MKVPRHSFLQAEQGLGSLRLVSSGGSKMVSKGLGLINANLICIIPPLNSNICMLCKKQRIAHQARSELFEHILQRVAFMDSLILLAELLRSSILKKACAAPFSFSIFAYRRVPPLF